MLRWFALDLLLLALAAGVAVGRAAEAAGDASEKPYAIMTTFRAGLPAEKRKAWDSLPLAERQRLAAPVVAEILREAERGEVARMPAPDAEEPDMLAAVGVNNRRTAIRMLLDAAMPSATREGTRVPAPAAADADAAVLPAAVVPPDVALSAALRIGEQVMPDNPLVFPILARAALHGIIAEHVAGPGGGGLSAEQAKRIASTLDGLRPWPEANGALFRREMRFGLEMMRSRLRKLMTDDGKTPEWVSRLRVSSLGYYSADEFFVGFEDMVNGETFVVSSRRGPAHGIRILAVNTGQETAQIARGDEVATVKVKSRELVYAGRMLTKAELEQFRYMAAEGDEALLNPAALAAALDELEERSENLIGRFERGEPSEPEDGNRRSFGVIDRETMHRVDAIIRYADARQQILRAMLELRATSRDPASADTAAWLQQNYGITTTVSKEDSAVLLSLPDPVPADALQGNRWKPEMMLQWK
ncbi:MAG: hypothetical protein LBK99_22210 [Opitutaceae bacterium]|jgi:hypothetical protein|nr:hypothetical protein [Opitutaceae bacterium]